jgi:hypothetical protein
MKNLGFFNGYILPSTKNINIDFYLNIRWEMEHQ